LESTLYPPVKRFLDDLGFEVKGEVCGCDLVALDGKEPAAVVIGELKLSFTFDLVLQAVDRTAACDEVWLAVRASRRGREHDPRVRKLCRLLGLLCVSASGKVDVLVGPVQVASAARRQAAVPHRRGAPAPTRRSRHRRQHAPADHDAYRQQALACCRARRRGRAISRTTCLMQQRSCCETSMAGSSEGSAASTHSPTRAERRWRFGRPTFLPRPPRS
jgi:hypothetical protein